MPPLIKAATRGGLYYFPELSPEALPTGMQQDLTADAIGVPWEWALGNQRWNLKNIVV